MFSLFPTVVEIQALMRFHDCSGGAKEKLLNIDSFVKSLRMPLEDRRHKIVKEAFCKINSEPGA